MVPDETVLPPDPEWDRAVTLARQFVAAYPVPLDLRQQALIALAFRWREKQRWYHVARRVVSRLRPRQLRVQ